MWLSSELSPSLRISLGSVEMGSHTRNVTAQFMHEDGSVEV